MQLGQKVKCSGYLKKQKKRYCLPAEAQLDEYQRLILENCNPIIIRVSDCIAQENYKIKECKVFEGIIVGEKNVCLQTFYGCDVNCFDKNFIYSFNKSNDYLLCYKVYYALGKSRLVPVNMIEVINNEN